MHESKLCALLPYLYKFPMFITQNYLKLIIFNITCFNTRPSVNFYIWNSPEICRSINSESGTKIKNIYMLVNTKV